MSFLQADPKAVAAALHAEHLPPPLYGRLYRNQGGPKARDLVDMSLDLRLWLLATQMSQRDGHCPLSPGELATLVPKADGTMFSTRHLNNAIAGLKRAGLLAPSASARCLRPASNVYEFSLKKQICGPCQAHDFYDR